MAKITNKEGKEVTKKKVTKKPVAKKAIEKKQEGRVDPCILLKKQMASAKKIAGR